MIYRLFYNNKYYKILNSYTLNKSSNSLSQSDITIDFTNQTFNDLPKQYQEVKIVAAEKEEDFETSEENKELVFTGFVNSFDFENMQLAKEERELTIELISPYAMSTLRTVSLVGTFEKEVAIRRILEPLINDGFTIRDLIVDEGQITTDFVLQKIEYCMNKLSYKLNLFWYINERKEIYIYSLDYLFSKEYIAVFDEKKLEELREKYGMYYLKPTIEDNEYANIINIKNIRLFYNAKDSDLDGDIPHIGDDIILEVPRTLKKGDVVNFENPIVLSEDYLRAYIKSLGTESPIKYRDFGILIEDTDGNRQLFESYIEDGEYKNSNNYSISSDGGDELQVVLVKDSFFSNLITGFKWNGLDGATVRSVESCTALRYTALRFMDSNEIENQKGIISDSGQIEKTVDFSNKWATIDEVTEYAKSLKVENSNVLNKIVVKLDKINDFKIGDIVFFDMPSFYCEGFFAITNIAFTYKNDENISYKITLRKSSLVGNFIDIFRAKETQENEDSISNIVLSEYIKENIFEKVEVDVDED